MSRVVFGSSWAERNHGMPDCGWHSERFRFRHMGLRLARKPVQRMNR